MHDFPHPHEHGDHEGEPQAPPDETDPIWAGERIELQSVGIDIGSSTSHLTFSRLVLRRLGESLSSRFRVVERDVLHQSPILLTPYRDPFLIDTERLDSFIRDTYARAGLTPDGIDTGAVVVTGEAAKKENAESILSLFAREAGRFVCAAAGPQLEAMMAAHGSGAVARSREGSGVFCVDIGGGTTKLAVCRDGQVAAVAVINVGGRLVAEDRGRITRLEEAGALVGDEVGLRLAVGQRIDDTRKAALAERMTACLFELIDRRPFSSLTRRLMHTPPLDDDGPIDVLMFSGGVSEYIYERERATFGDLGKALGGCQEPPAPPPARREPGDASRRHPGHGHRRGPVHGAGQREHDLHAPARSSSHPQLAGPFGEAWGTAERCGSRRSRAAGGPGPRCRAARRSSGACHSLAVWTEPQRADPVGAGVGSGPRRPAGARRGPEPTPAPT